MLIKRNFPQSFNYDSRKIETVFTQLSNLGVCDCDLTTKSCEMFWKRANIHRM